MWICAIRQPLLSTGAALALSVFSLWGFAQHGSAADADRVQRFLLSSSGSQGATNGTGNKIITHGKKTHVAWLDHTEAGYICRVRTLDRETNQWSPTYTLGKAPDNHGRPAMTIDSKGYLHVVYGMHHDTIPYRRTLRPGDASQWTDEIRVKAKLTYPTLVCGPDDTLYLTGRDMWRGVRMYSKRPEAGWEDHGLIIRRRKDGGSYAGFQIGLAWGPDHRTLYLSCGIYDGTSKEKKQWGRYQSANYMRSSDFGKTWQRADGTPIELPATAETMDVLLAAQSVGPKPGIRNQGAVVVDSRGHPYVLYFRNTEHKHLVFLATPDEQGRWQQRPLQQAMDKHYPGWAVVSCRAGLSITEDDVLCLALAIAPVDHPKARWDGIPLGQPGQPARWAFYSPEVLEIAWLESRDGGKTFKARNIVERDPEVGHASPSLERPTGFNHIAAGRYPALIYYTSVPKDARQDHQNTIPGNQVYFVQPR